MIDMKKIKVGDKLTITDISEYEDPNYEMVALVERIDHAYRELYLKVLEHKKSPHLVGVRCEFNYEYHGWEKVAEEVLQF